MKRALSSSRMVYFCKKHPPMTALHGLQLNFLSSRQLMSDPELRGVSHVVLDEVSALTLISVFVSFHLCAGP